MKKKDLSKYFINTIEIKLIYFTDTIEYGNMGLHRYGSTFYNI